MSADIRPLLNPHAAYPHRLDPVPQDWLRQFASFSPLAAPADADTAEPLPNHYED